ncbi:MAG: citryl-CoA lyase [Granulicella sp.]
MLEPWRTGITTYDEKNIWISGYEVGSLMQHATFAETIFLLHAGRMPSKEEGKLVDAILISSADHGPGSPSAATARLACSGNRGSVSSAIAAGILAIGDQHGGAGMACMELIAEGIALAKSEKLSLEVAAERLIDTCRARGERLPGMGHRQHSTDPRKAILFGMAESFGLAGEGVRFMLALEAGLAKKVKPLPVNIDGVLAAILFDLGFPPIMGRLIFIIGRTAGLSAEVAEELAREKAMRIKVPVTYDGPPPRDLPKECGDVNK